MKKLLVVLTMLIMVSYAFAKYNVGDMVSNFEWEHSNGVDARTTVSLDELTAAHKVIVLEFSEVWCPPCNAIAPHLEEIWQEFGGLGNQKLYIAAALTEINNGAGDLTWEGLDGASWRGRHGITHWLAMDQLSNFKSQLSTYDGGIPHACIIDTEGKLYWGGNPGSPEFEEKIKEAVYAGQNIKPNVDSPLADPEISIGESADIDLSEAFITDDGADWTVSVTENTNEAVISHVINGKTLTLTANTVGVATITLEAVCGDETATVSLDAKALAGDVTWNEWGENYDFGGAVGVGTAPWKAAIDYDFGTAEVSVTALEVGMSKAESGMTWKIVSFEEGKPTDTVIGDLTGTFNAIESVGTLIGVDSATKISGHVAFVIESAGNFCALDAAATSEHTWAYAEGNWALLTELAAQFPGAWYMRLGTSNGESIESILPNQLSLYQNYPNPFNPATTIKFNNPAAGNVKLAVYNVKGEMVAELVNKDMTRGMKSIDFNASALNSGVYYYTLQANGMAVTKKMILVK